MATPKSDEIRDRAFEAISGLVRTLGRTLEVDEVVRRALLTVTGQFLTRRSAFYLWDGKEQRFASAGSLGLRVDVVPETMEVDPAAFQTADGDDVLRPLDVVPGLPESVHEQFEFLAAIDDGEDLIGVLFLGGPVVDRMFEDQDRQLLQAMGMIIGTTLARSMAFQELTEAKRRSEEAERVRREILDHVSHEFNTPLMVLRNCVDLIPLSDEAEVGDLVSMMGPAQQRLEYLVRSVLRAAMGDEYTGSSHEPVEQVQAWLQDLVDKESPTGEAQIRFCGLGSVGDVLADAATVHTMVGALVENAWKFQPDDRPWVVVLAYPATQEWWERQPHVQRLAWYQEAMERQAGDLTGGIALDAGDPPPSDDASDVLVLEVVDPGDGIPADQLDLVFQPFSQASNSATRGIRGAGVGLPSVRRTARGMGGDLLVRSEEGTGSVFAILLPLEASDV